ncbi:MAG: hypothetical protein AABY22_33820, partial [Nanoarchaeota archaeon]
MESNKPVKPVLHWNMILKEDEPVEMVKRAIESFYKYVDSLVVGITYSEKPPTENHPLVKLLNKYKAKIVYFQWVHDFSKARQFVMDNTPHGQHSFIGWCDADDVLQNGHNLRNLLEE